MTHGRVLPSLDVLYRGLIVFDRAQRDLSAKGDLPQVKTRQAHQPDGRVSRNKWEIVISLSCEQNSARKFQSGVSNSGFQIPKHARQNSEVTENSCFTLQKPMERPQNSSRRFLDSCFCFRVPFRGWNLGRFPFPISRFSVQIQGR